MSETESVPPQISAEEVANRRDDDDLFVLDVRTEDDIEEWEIEGSHNLPIYDDLLDEEFGGLEAHLDELPTDREIAIVCVAGITSARAATWLRERGYSARSMSDGMRGWGRVHQAYDVDAAPGIVQVVRPGTGCISYLVHDSGEALLVDPSQYLDEYEAFADDLDVDIVGAVDTHAHADHISGGRLMAEEWDVPYYLHEDDSGNLDDYTPLQDKETITVGETAVDVLHTPGHTPGSVSLRFGDELLSGDTLFIESVGRPDLEDGSEEAIREASDRLFDSLDRLAQLRDDSLVLPGHFSDESVRPLVTSLYDLQRGNELFELVLDGERETFVETIVEALSETPNNYQQIKHINWGDEPLDEDAEDLELGPNNCAAN